MDVKLKAIVLKAVDYKDNDKILTLFSLERGIVSAGIKGVKKANAKLKFAVQPFCFCDYVLSENGGRLTVTQASIIESFYGIREDVVKFYCGAVALNYCKQFLFEGIVSPALFILLLEFLKSLEFSDNAPKLVLCKFLFEALNLSGYKISVGNCGKCGKTIVKRAFFDFNSGEAVCFECSDENDVEFNYKTLSLLNSLKLSDFNTLSNDCDFDESVHNKCLKFFTYYIEIKANVKLKSLSELLQF